MWRSGGSAVGGGAGAAADVAEAGAVRGAGGALRAPRARRRARHARRPARLLGHGVHAGYYSLFIYIFFSLLAEERNGRHLCLIKLIKDIITCFFAVVENLQLLKSVINVY